MVELGWGEGRSTSCRDATDSFVGLTLASFVVRHPLAQLRFFGGPRDDIDRPPEAAPLVERILQPLLYRGDAL
jgi:hypothetical protein